MSRIQLAAWEPDKFGLLNHGQITAKNVFASGTGYCPIKALSEISTTGLDSQAIGAFSATDATGTTNTFAGTSDKLYHLAAATFSDVSKSGGYTIGGTERWEFAQFGQRVIAVSISQAPQYYDLGSSTLFANLAGSPPTARHIGIVRDFVVLGNDTTSPNNVTWSGINASDSWTAGVGQSDSQILPDGGWINGIFGGDVGYIFQERAITRMTYIGPPLYFQFDVLERNRGLACPGAGIKIGEQIFYYAQDGFFVKAGDAESVSIGNQKVDNWFATNLMPNTFYLISCGADPANKLVYWSFVGSDATDASHPNTVLIYNYSNQEWSYGKFDHEMLFPALSEGWTLEGIGNVYSSIESVPVSFDSRVWTGGTAYLAAFDTSHQLCTFGGSTLAGVITTADFEGIEGKRAFINNMRPLTDASGITAVCNYRERFADSVSGTTSASMQSNGDIPLTASGRFFQATLNIPAASTWTYANGLDVDVQEDGDI